MDSTFPIWKALDVIFTYWHLTGHEGMLLVSLTGPQILQKFGINKNICPSGIWSSIYKF
jgi:hypothetical protein